MHRMLEGLTKYMYIHFMFLLFQIAGKTQVGKTQRVIKLEIAELVECYPMKSEDVESSFDADFEPVSST